MTYIWASNDTSDEKIMCRKNCKWDIFLVGRQVPPLSQCSYVPESRSFFLWVCRLKLSPNASRMDCILHYIHTTCVVSMVERRQTKTNSASTFAVLHWTDSARQTRRVQLTFRYWPQTSTDSTHWPRYIRTYSHSLYICIEGGDDFRLGFGRLYAERVTYHPLSTGLILTKRWMSEAKYSNQTGKNVYLSWADETLR